MTDEQIIKALETCAKNRDSDAYCHECPYFNDSYCLDKMIADALDFIKSQNAEIERLKVECGKAQYEKYRADFEEFRAEIKADAVKEFAERLKAKFDKYGVDYTAYTMGDDIVREMGVEQ